MIRPAAARVALALALVAALTAGCSRKEEAPKPGAARPMSVIWPDMLAQRDIIQKLLHKPIEEVNHADCSELGAAARKVDDLTNELLNAASQAFVGDESKLRATGDVVIRLQGVTAQVRESALAEAPGRWPGLAFPLDQSLHSVESYFTPEDLGGQSVAARPDFETKPLPAPLSPV